MTEPRGPVFLERRSYRRRRLTDAARILPLLGIFLFLLPLIWSADPAAPASSARGLVYLFLIWAVLIAGALITSRHLTRPAPPPGPADDEARAR